MTDEITLARLRELADIVDRCRMSAGWPELDEAAEQAATALRAAADTLAAREALLRRAHFHVRNSVDTYAEHLKHFQNACGYADVVAAIAKDLDDARVLAAEIAAALKETDQ